METRPSIKYFFPEKTDIKTVHAEYTQSPHLYSYSSALDRHIDSLEEQSKQMQQRIEELEEELHSAKELLKVWTSRKC